MALQAVLEPLGHRLVRAASGREAIERVRSEEFAVILLDVNMPIMDGFQTAERIRELPRTRSTPIIFVSAVDRDPAEIRKGYSYGAVDFLVKPLVQEILRAKVAVFIELFLQSEQLKQRKATEDKLRELRLEVSTALGQAGELRQMLDGCCEALVKHLGGALARLWILNPDTQMLELQASAGTHRHLDGAHARVPVGRYKIGLIAQEGRPYLTNDLLNDPRLSDPAWAAANKFIAFAGYPLLVDGRCIGVAAMFAQKELSEATLSSVSLVADAIAQGIVRKQTELALQERARELARSNEELERFAYVASHDLQEPLRMVASYTQLLGRRYKGKLDTDADEFIAFAVDGVTRMQALINDLLTFSRVGTQGGALLPLDLGTAVAAALINLRGAIESSGAVVTTDVLPTVLANERQMVQLFQNLIGNAIKFHGPEAPRIHVGAEQLADEWQITVRDNGIGIDPAFWNRLFVVFARLHNRSEYEGNGIGLAICKKIIERHGGRIWLQSLPGQGSTFFFTLHGVKS